MVRNSEPNLGFSDMRSTSSASSSLLCSFSAWSKVCKSRVPTSLMAFLPDAALETLLDLPASLLCKQLIVLQGHQEEKYTGEPVRKVSGLIRMCGNMADGTHSHSFVETASGKLISQKYAFVQSFWTVHYCIDQCHSSCSVLPQTSIIHFLLRLTIFLIIYRYT